jgi:hypothetical protein
LNSLFVADPGGLSVLVGDDLVEPITQAVLRPLRSDLRAIESGHQVGIEQPCIDIDPILDHAAAVSLVWEESTPPASRVGIGATAPIIRDA